jgi:hypothetical protein
MPPLTSPGFAILSKSRGREELIRVLRNVPGFFKKAQFSFSKRRRFNDSAVPIVPRDITTAV